MIVHCVIAMAVLQQPARCRTPEPRVAMTGYLAHVQPSFVIDKTFLLPPPQLRQQVLAPSLDPLNSFGAPTPRGRVVKTPPSPNPPLAIIDAVGALTAVPLDGLDTV